MTKKHALIMIACCMIPIVAFALISVFSVPVSSMVTIGLVLLCPISHLLLMKFIMPGHNHGEEHQQNAEQKQIGARNAGAHSHAQREH